MHGGANLQHPAMHGGGVRMPRGCHLPACADVDPAMIHGGLGRPRRGSWRVRVPRRASWRGCLWQNGPPSPLTHNAPRPALPQPAGSHRRRAAFAVPARRPACPPRRAAVGLLAAPRARLAPPRAPPASRAPRPPRPPVAVRGRAGRPAPLQLRPVLPRPWRRCPLPRPLEGRREGNFF